MTDKTADKIAETRDRYRYWLSIPTRWMDGDPYGHVNNAQYYSFIDTVVTTMLIEKQVLRGPHWDAIGLVIESQCVYSAPITFPEIVEAGLRIGRVGGSSLRYEVALFKQGEDKPAAVAHFVHVFVDPQTRRPLPLVEPVRKAMLELTLG
ncbi:MULTISPECIES: acyl-CoA thioesterase [Hydrocarboniphaga]|jgi:acyl-CoA thioester hydrolase|uniref:Thioesterase family protein n=1 Tax=Hydrocarboniphaga effusa AP103 TaxID=1172194 RepID=I8TA80_9GAMM|nr:MULTISPECIES: thioesterase family protein [Hydrocarboniphaga]EIT70788.1 thioesterase family protein [Hydrocarboniphaga effusa AP103]MDZ4079838.1 thioesterase family protein [Hydrocarboniphaga sp.]